MHLIKYELQRYKKRLNINLLFSSEEKRTPIIVLIISPENFHISVLFLTNSLDDFEVVTCGSLGRKYSPSHLVLIEA